MEVKKGYIPSVITPDNYVLGASTLPQVILRDNGQWTDYLPTGELQNKGNFESYNCTSFATLNVLEILMKEIYNQ